MQSRSIARELALLTLGQVSDKSIKDIQSLTIENLLNNALEGLNQHWREGLDSCANKLEIAQEQLLDSELQETDQASIATIRQYLMSCLVDAELVLNGLSTSLDFPRLLAMSEQENTRLGAMERVRLVVEYRQNIDKRLDDVMEGWRLHRLPKIDRDILRLAVVDLLHLDTPVAVACNEAVDLANRYSDEQGRRMINGVLRRLQNSFSTVS